MIEEPKLKPAHPTSVYYKKAPQAISGPPPSMTSGEKLQGKIAGRLSLRTIWLTMKSLGVWIMESMGWFSYR